MEVLPFQFEEKGFIYTQLKRKKKVALYQQHHEEWPQRSNRYEVIKIKVLPATIIHGKQYNEREIYPKSEEWGERGWSYNTYEEALIKYSKMG